MTTANVAATRVSPDYTAIKSKQQATWGSGDYGRIGITLQITGEALCEAMDIRSGQSVLDVAAGNGNASLAAARRFCKVVSTDYVPSLLDQSRIRAAAENLAIDYHEADAEALPFADASFDNVVSTFGVMFAPNQGKAASELIRVCKKGGKIGLANWTPDGFVGQLFKTVGRHVPPPPGVNSPAAWGTRGVSRRAFRLARVEGRRDAAAVQLSLSLAGTLARYLQHLLRTRAEGVRSPRRSGPGIPAAGSRAVDRAPQPGHRRHHGRTLGLPRDRDFPVAANSRRTVRLVHRADRSRTRSRDPLNR